MPINFSGTEFLIGFTLVSAILAIGARFFSREIHEFLSIVSPPWVAAAFGLRSTLYRPAALMCQSATSTTSAGRCAGGGKPASSS